MPDVPAEDRAAVVGESSLENAWSDLYTFEKETLRPLLYRVFGAANFEGEQTVTHEQIGRLTIWATEIATLTGAMKADVENLQEAVVRDFTSIINDGKQCDEPHFDRFGRRNA